MRNSSAKRTSLQRWRGVCGGRSRLGGATKNTTAQARTRGAFVFLPWLFLASPLSFLLFRFVLLLAVFVVPCAVSCFNPFCGLPHTLLCRLRLALSPLRAYLAVAVALNLSELHSIQLAKPQTWLRVRANKKQRALRARNTRRSSNLQPKPKPTRS